jgi:hypothetical protein
MNCYGLLVNAAITLAAVASSALASDPIEDALAATFRITNRQSAATCFFVSSAVERSVSGRSAVLVTAAHFLEQTSDSECQVVYRVENADKTFSRKEVSVSIRNGDALLWKKHPETDIAAMRVVLPDNAAVKPFDISQLATESSLQEWKIRVGQQVSIPCFPAKLEANEAGWPILRRGFVASHPLAPVRSARTILIDASTFGGDSGAPVVVASEDKSLVIGLALGMLRQTDSASLSFEQLTFHTPLGLAIVVQATFIRETIESLPK